MPKPCFIYPEQNNIDNTTYLIGKLFSKKMDKRKARETIFCPNKRRNTKNECILLTRVKKCIQQGQTVHRSEVIDKRNIVHKHCSRYVTLNAMRPPRQRL